MTRRPRSLRRRLRNALVAISVGSIAAVVVITFLFAQATAREAALDDLEAKAAVLAQFDESGSIDRSLVQLRRLLEVERAGLVFIGPDGTIIDPGVERRAAPTTVTVNRRRQEQLKQEQLKQEQLRREQLRREQLRRERAKREAQAQDQPDQTVVGQGETPRVIGSARPSRQAPTPEPLVTTTVPAIRAGTPGLPAGVGVGDLDVDALLAGKVQRSGTGRLTVFVAQPLRARAVGAPVIVLADEVGIFPLGRIGPFLLAAVFAAIALAALISFVLSKRLARPLAEMERTARAIADGQLGARVDSSDDLDDELASLAAALDSMAAQLEAGKALERSFLLSVSHDLRTPLTSIQGYAEAIADGTVADGEGRSHAAAIIASEAKRLERLVADLLDLARLDTRQFSLHMGMHDVATIVMTVAEGFRPRAAEAGIAVEVDAVPGAVANVDPERLGQIVSNLVENAWKYAKKRITVRVDMVGTTTSDTATSDNSVGNAAPGGPVRIEVIDDGPGIDAADLPHVFERLYSSRRVLGRKVGTGLGLAIVRELVQRMGGTVQAENMADAGARMIVTLPPASSRSSSSKRVRLGRTRGV